MPSWASLHIILKTSWWNATADRWCYCCRNQGSKEWVKVWSKWLTISDKSAETAFDHSPTRMYVKPSPRHSWKQAHHLESTWQAGQTLDYNDTHCAWGHYQSTWALNLKLRALKLLRTVRKGFGDERTGWIWGRLEEIANEQEMETSWGISTRQWSTIVLLVTMFYRLCMHMEYVLFNLCYQSISDKLYILDN